MINKHRPELSPEELSMFLDAVSDAVPIRAPTRAADTRPSPPPVPVQSLLDVHVALEESVTGPIPWHQSMETGEELVFLREGLPKDVLKKLRRGYWVVQDEVDLHGHNREQARILIARFLLACAKRGARCVRIVHGKGLRSPNRQPVLKSKIKQWLAKRDEVLAFCQAPVTQGGSGALLVLLKAT